MRRNQIILKKFILLLWFFKNEEGIPQEYFSFKNIKLIFLVIPESFLTLILCPFWHEHTCSVSYQKDPALFDSFKIPHQVVVVVSNTVWALELASLSKNKFLFTALTGQHNKINLRPSRKGRQSSIVLRRQAEIIVCDMNVRRLCNSCCTQWVKNNPVVGLRMVLLFSRLSWKTPNIYVSMEQKICLKNIFWWVKCDGNSTNIIVLSVFFG